MPIFEYVCDDCQTRYERIVMSANQEITCPKCASERNRLQLSVFSAGKSAKSSAGDGPGPACANCCNSDTCGLN